MRLRLALALTRPARSGGPVLSPFGRGPPPSGHAKRHCLQMPASEHAAACRRVLRAGAPKGCRREGGQKLPPGATPGTLKDAGATAASADQEATDRTLPLLVHDRPRGVAATWACTKHSPPRTFMNRFSTTEELLLMYSQPFAVNFLGCPVEPAPQPCH